MSVLYCNECDKLHDMDVLDYHDCKHCNKQFCDHSINDHEDSCNHREADEDPPEVDIDVLNKFKLEN